MPPDQTQPTTPSEPAQTPAEPQSTPIITPEPTQVTTEPMPASTADSTATNMPPEDPEGPASPSTPSPGHDDQGQNTPTETPSAPAASTSLGASPVPAPTTEPVSQAPAPTTVTQTPPPQAVSVLTSIPIVSRLAEAFRKRIEKKQKRLDKIMELAREKKVVKNDDIEKLIHVSDATATRYLDQLVKEGKLRKNGNRGSVDYHIL